MAEEQVRRFYSAHFKEEWYRLIRSPYARLEFATTVHFLDKYLERRKLLILDAGGGPGRYAVELARRGHHVVLVDPVSENLRFAEKQVKRSKLRGEVGPMVEASIEDLSVFPDGMFDVTLCLTPLSHVLEPGQREKAVSELLRVLKPQGLLFASAIGRLPCLVLALENGFKLSGLASARELRDTGNFQGERVFTRFHGFLPEELKRLFEGIGGLRVLEIAGLDGLGSTHSRAVNAVARDPRAWKFWLETHYATCTEPSVIGLSEQVLLIAQKH